MGTRGRGLLVAGGAAVALGAAGWLLGPGWAAAGVVAGPVAALVIAASWQAHARTGTADLLRAGRAGEALSRLDQELPSWRTAARIWPGQFRDALASQLVDRSFALRRCGRDAEAAAAAGEAVLAFRELAAARPRKFTAGLADVLYRVSYPLAAAGRDKALAAAEEAVQLYRGLAAARPARYAPLLALSLTRQAILLASLGRPGDALAAATAATGLYQSTVAADRYPYSGAQALLVEGRVLCDLSRQREAARPLAQGWQAAASGDYQDLLCYARPALQTACQAGPAGFISTWRAETGTEPPDWLTRPDSTP
jgi:tetratricopeptide (TPR) repeat protein